MSSLGETGRTSHFKESGFAACLSKPWRQAELLDCLVAALAGGVGPASQHPSAASSPLPAHFRRRARILLAEDNTINQQVATGMLSKLGLTADAVANGEEACRAVVDLPYDLLLMDLQMPVMDGLEATRRIRKGEVGATNGRQVPIIAMTAHVLQRDREICLKAGMNDFVTKPVDPRTLAEVLDKWLPRNAADTPVLPVEPPASQPPAKASRPMVYNRQALLGRVMGDEGFLKSLEQTFLEGMPGQLAVLADLAGRGDWTSAGKQAHGIKGAAANVGGEAMQEVAAAVEQAGRQGDGSAVTNLLPQLTAEFERLRQAMEA